MPLIDRVIAKAAHTQKNAEVKSDLKMAVRSGFGSFLKDNFYKDVCCFHHLFRQLCKDRGSLHIVVNITKDL